MADQHLFSKTLKTTKPADSERLAGGSGSSSDYNFTWTKLREWIGDIASFIFTGSLQVGGSLTAETITNSTGDFLTAPTNGGLVTQRTDAEVLSDIGAASASLYWKNDGTSTATGNWNIGSNSFTSGVITSNGNYLSTRGGSNTFLRSSTNGFTGFGSSTSLGTGVSVLMYGDTHSVLPNIYKIRIGGADKYILSASGHDFRAEDMVTTGTLTAGDITSTGTTIDFNVSGTVLTVGVGADNGTVSAGIFTDRTKHYEGDALKEIKEIKGLGGEIVHSTLPSFAQAKVKKTNTILGEKIIVEAVDAFNDKEVLKDGVKIDDGIYYTQTETIEETEDDERDLGAMISVLTKGIQQQLAINEDLINRIKQLENNI